MGTEQATDNMQDEKQYTVNFSWDKDSAVWIATSEDVEGLVLESGSFDALVERVRHAIPELLELNAAAPKVIDIAFTSKRSEQVALYG